MTTFIDIFLVLFCYNITLSWSKFRRGHRCRALVFIEFCTIAVGVGRGNLNVLFRLHLRNRHAELRCIAVRIGEIRRRRHLNLDRFARQGFYRIAGGIDNLRIFQGQLRNTGGRSGRRDTVRVNGAGQIVFLTDGIRSTRVHIKFNIIE